MNIWKKLSPENIFLAVPLQNKDAVLRFVADLCVKNGMVTHADALYEGLKQREDTMSTGVGGGIAFPHARSPEATDATVLLLRPLEPVDFESLDALPVDIVLALIIPEADISLHIQLLAGASRLCRHSEFLKAVRETGTPHELLDIIRNLEEKMPFH